MSKGPHRGKRTPRKEEAGVIMLMVVLLVVMFTGLGLLAMRHTHGELRSAGAYMDSTQAVAAAEAAILMVATDMRRNWRYPNTSQCKNYYQQFQAYLQGEITVSGDTDTDNDSSYEEIRVGFSDVFNSDDAACNHLGGVPYHGFRQNEPLARTAQNADTDGDPVGPMAAGFADVQLLQSQPQVAPPPPGFSVDDENRTYDWYYFIVTSRAYYGPHSTLEADARSAVRGHATVRSNMKIGPIDAITSN